MLQQTNPEIVKLYTQIDNCNTLREIIQRKIDDNHPLFFLDSYCQMCGSFGCVLGDYIIARSGLNKWFEIYDLADEFHSSAGYREEFGMMPSSQVYHYEIFGTAQYGDYEHRQKLLNTHITHLESKVAALIS